VKFGPAPLSQALGAILGHTLKVGVRVLKKGRALEAQDLGDLEAAGYREIVCARLDPDDVREDPAAQAIAEAVAGPGVSVAAPAAGRCNLFARVRGVLSVQQRGVDQLNLTDEAVTLATLPAFTLVAPDELIATVKIIPYAIARALLERATELARTGPPLVDVAPLAPARAGLVLTRLPGTADSVLAHAAACQRTRMERLGSSIARELRCAHEEAQVAACLSDLIADGCSPILVLGASAIADRNDVVPAAIVRVGGVIDHFGMPVDPGNLLLLAHHGATPVVGVPGCARSLKPSGFDWVLARLVAGLAVAPRDLQTLGVGGLLAEVPSRPQPRLGEQPAERQTRVVGAVVLAAGSSQRMGGENKLLSLLGGRPLIAHVVDALLASAARPIVVVTGHQAADVRAALAGRAVEFAHNPDFASGLASSLRVGIGAVGAAVDGALICLGDMPLVTRDHIDALVRAFEAAGDHSIYVPTHERKRGHPILWARRHFAEMAALTGDVGARGLLDRYAAEICYVEVGDPGISIDVDTPAMLQALERGSEE